MPPVTLDAAVLARLAGRLKRGPLPPAPDFVFSRETPWFPPRGAAWAAPFFFATVKHLYGLWDEDGERFTGPVRGSVDGRECDGDDFLWKAAARAAQEEPAYPLASFQAAMTADTFRRLFRADSGECPVPLLKSHVELARAYGAALEEGKLSPNKILQAARGAADPVAAFVAAAGELPGYREDPFRRKALLLAFILSSRPEKFLEADGAAWAPMLDRHMIRLAIRWGALRFDAALEKPLADGLALPPPIEAGFRTAAYEAFRELHAASGRSVPETFGLFAAARDFCPETRPPDCPSCFFREECGRRAALRQPVVRTLNY